MTELKLTDDQKVQLRRGNGEGLLYFNACPMCGACELRSFDESKPDDVIVQEGTIICGRCQEVHQRNPEVAQWVLSVIAWYDLRKGRKQ